MAKSLLSIADVLDNIFLAVAFPWAANPSFYIALHTGDPGVGGNQTTSETGYVGYNRIAVARNVGGWATLGTTRLNNAIILFPLCVAVGPSVLTYVSIGLLATPGAGEIIYSGALDSPLTVDNGIQPQFAPTALVIQEV
jgi:hypothetical protein